MYGKGSIGDSSQSIFLIGAKLLNETLRGEKSVSENVIEHGVPWIKAF